MNLQPLLAASELGGFSGSLNLTVSFEGQPGDLVMATGSVDQSGTYVFEVEPQGVSDSMGKEAHYWTVANGFDTIFSLWNPTDQAQDYVVTFFYGDGSGEYNLPVRLDGQASTTLDMAHLIAAGASDAEGNVIRARFWREVRHSQAPRVTMDG